MREVVQFLMSDVEFGEYFVPVVVLVAAGFAGVSFMLKSSWPSVVGGVLLVMIYLLPAPH